MKELFCLKKSAHSRGSVLLRWDPSCKYLATVGQNRVVHVTDRSGAAVDEFALPGKSNNAPMQIEWDKEGENLAVMCDALSVVMFWNVYSRKTSQFETNLKDPSFMCWSRSGPQLAIGTGKGNLLLYNADSKKSNLIQGKHTKKITCGQWNLDNRLALASLDKTMSINDERGELLEQPKLKYDPCDLQFAEQKVDEKSSSSAREMTVSVNMGQQTILMYNMADSENPVELAFQSKYGEIAAYRWFGDGYMMVGFSKGYVIAISTHMKEIGEELQSLRVHEQRLVDVVYSAQLNKLATAGDDGVRVVDMADWKELKSEHREFSREEGDPERMEWTRDGQILSVATSGGYVFNFLMSIPVLSAAWGTRLVYLSSLRTVSVLDVVSDASPVVAIDIAIEPSFLAMGPAHVAVGMNNHAWFHSWTQPPASSASSGPSAAARAREAANQPVHEREYLGSVRQIALNDTYAAVLLDNGKLNLHLIAGDAASDRDSKIFPEPAAEEKEGGAAGASGVRVTCMALTSDFLIYGTSRGTLHHFYLKDWAQVVEHRHESAIASLYSNPIGTRLVVIDADARGWFFSPVDDHKFEIPSFPSSGVEKVLFDQLDHNTFALVDSRNSRTVSTYSYASQTSRGPSVSKSPALTKLQPGLVNVVLLVDGVVYGQKASGVVTSMTLSSHDAISNVNKPAATNMRASRSSDRLRAAFTQLLALNRLKAAWELSLQLRNRDCYTSLARKALEQLDVELALRAYRELGDTAMVLALTDIVGVEDRDLLAGHILLLQGEYQTAQKLFLSSSDPAMALQMRRDLLNWDLALKLAAQLAPAEIPLICREYAQSLEVKGEYAQALATYQRALQHDAAALAGPSRPPKLPAEHLKTVQGGIARMTLRVGDLQRGRQLALQSGDKQLLRDCAAILEQMKQFADAADLYVQAEQYEKAAAIYNQTLNFAKAAPLMDRITTPKIHLQYAKAKEAAKEYAVAAAAYEKAKDLDSVVRLNLQHLDNPTRAFALVRQTKSAEGAALVAQYCTQHNNFQAAVEFLLLAKRGEEAFRLAKEHRQVDVYARALGEDGTMDEYAAIALYYDDAGDWANAAHYYARIGEYAKSIKLFLQCDTQHIDAAIGVVKKAQGSPGAELLVRQLHDFLIGETDGKVKDLNYIFRLYMAIGEFAQAASTAVLIANQEQANGQYAVAHSILFAMAQDLTRERLALPGELRRNLLLLHSYTLAKKMSARKEHDLAARMLIRVSRHISRFPAHVVPILTSTVIECQRAGLKRDSLEFAKILLRPEHKPKVPPQYLKPIEGFVRRPPPPEELEKEKPESSSPCPFCNFDLPDSLLDCPACKNNIPYCITTGKHMVLSEWSECPSCHFPTLYSSFVHFLSTSPDKKCAMCDAVVSLADVAKVADPRAKLMQAAGAADEKEKEKESGGAAGGESSAAASSAGPGKGDVMDAVDIQPVFK